MFGGRYHICYENAKNLQEIHNESFGYAVKSEIKNNLQNEYE